MIIYKKLKYQKEEVGFLKNLNSAKQIMTQDFYNGITGQIILDTDKHIAYTTQEQFLDKFKNELQDYQIVII